MPEDSAVPTGVQAAASYIRELLLRPGRYRRRWEQYAERSRAGQVNQLAVAEVLAHYLWQHPRAKGDLDVLPRQLKDTASRALSGKLLSKATLVLFMEAFGLGAGEREQLLKLWEGSVEFLRDTVTDPAQRSSVAIGRTSADRLLRSIDDVRDLLSITVPPPAALEEFDLALCTGEIIQVLQLASGRPNHMILDAPPRPLLVTQDQKAVQQVLSRVLEAAFKLSQASGARIRLRPFRFLP